MLFFHDANINSGNHVDVVGYQTQMSPVATRAKAISATGTERAADRETLLSKHTSARLNTVLNYAVYKKPPPVFGRLVRENESLILLKSRFGLRKAPKAWNEFLEIF